MTDSPYSISKSSVHFVGCTALLLGVLMYALVAARLPSRAHLDLEMESPLPFAALS